MTDSDEIKQQIAEMRAMIASQANEIAHLKAKWDRFENDMIRMSRNPSLVVQQVQQQMRAHGIRLPLIQR
ncbi:hypothetical protein [Pseudorhodoplanes sp.]|uniref:hypothetical protein n=1 Tax=Pseudorhodoplanes sp. TaxID=1934341 RepID=UPI00391AC912